jgi:YVTN family beta-propeller protein
MKTRLLLNPLGVALLLVIVLASSNLTQSQQLLYPTPTLLVKANDAETQGAPETSYGVDRSVNDQLPLHVHQSAALNSSVVATIPVGLSPAGIGVNTVTNHIYVANRNANTVSVIDGTTQQVIATIPVGTRPSLQIGVNAATNRIYVPNNGGNSLAVIDGATHTVITTVTGLAASPEGVAVHPGRNLIYVTHNGDQLSVIDGATHSISTSLNTGAWNHFVAINANTDLAYVSISDPDTVAVMDLVTQQKTTDILDGGHPAINPRTNRVYLARYAEPVIGVVDGTTQAVITLIDIEDIPGFAAVNPTNNRIYVTLPNRDKVVVIDGMTNVVVGTISVGEHPLGIAVNPDTGLVYVGNANSNTVSVIQDDKDGDGLFDVWETQGLTVTVGNAAVFVDLPAMGANPDKKDIFVEVDYMVAPGLCLPLVGCHFGHSHQPKPTAIARVVQAFADAPVANPDGSQGITLHVDYGPDSIMNPGYSLKVGG